MVLDINFKKGSEKVKISKINPLLLSQKELERLQKGQKVKTKFFGTIKLLTEEESIRYPNPNREIDIKHTHFLIIKFI